MAAAASASTSEGVVDAMRKLVVRALDAKITQQDDPTALAAIETALKLCSNIVAHPGEEKYRRFRSNNVGISKKLLNCPGGQDLLIALGFRTKVMEFEEWWTIDEGQPLAQTMAEGCMALERYRELVRVRLERNVKLREERLANMNDERARTLVAIEEDKAERKQRQIIREDAQKALAEDATKLAEAAAKQEGVAVSDSS